MPIVTVTLRKPKAPQFKDMVLEVVHGALVASGAHQDDIFHRILELEPENFRFHATYPDVKTARTDDFVFVEILLGVGRSVKVKKQIVGAIAAQFAARNLDPENVMVVFQDVPWENLSPAGGRIPHA